MTCPTSGGPERLSEKTLPRGGRRSARHRLRGGPSAWQRPPAQSRSFQFSLSLGAGGSYPHPAMRPLLLLAPLAWLLLAQAKDDAKLEGEGAVWGAVAGSLAEDPRVQATWGRRAGELGCGLLSTCPRVTPTDHFLSWSHDSHVYAAGRRGGRYISPFSNPIQSTEEPVIIPIISSKAPVAPTGPTAARPHQLREYSGSTSLYHPHF